MSVNLIRRVTPQDLAALMQMVRSMQREHSVVNPDALTETLIRKSLFAPVPTLRALIADTGVSLAGFAFYTPTFSIFRAGPAMHVDAVYVREVYRNQGLARAFLGTILAECKEEGIAGVTWLAARNRPEEEALLVRLGVRPHDNLRFVRMQVSAFERSGLARVPEWRRQVG